jgi:hypothetical protein
VSEHQHYAAQAALCLPCLRTSDASIPDLTPMLREGFKLHWAGSYWIEKKGGKFGSKSAAWVLAYFLV